MKATFKTLLKNRAVWALCAILLTVLCEVFIFNFQSFKLNGDYTKITPNLENAVISGFDVTDDGLISTSKNPFIEFTNVNAEIGTLYINATVEKDACVSYTVDFTDSTNSSYRLRTGLVDGKIAYNAENTKYVDCQFSGKVGKLKIKFSLDSGETLIIAKDGISFNKDIPVDFSFLRVGVILLCAFLGYFLLKSRAGKANIEDAQITVNTVTALVCIIACLCAMLMTPNLLGKSIAQPSGDQITKELVDAFANGRLTLDRQVEQELLKLKNPYDWSERLENGTSYAWDHVMFEGKYYSYYGIAPVVLLFLPFHLITGDYFSTAFAVFLFGCIGLIFLSLFFRSLCRRFFGKITLGMYTCALLMLVISCGVWYCFMTPNFYEIAQNCGFMFVCLGAYFLVSSGIFSENVSKIKICLSSVFLSLAVLSRPTTAVWCIAAVAFISFGAFDMKKGGKKAKAIVGFLACALIPFAVIGSVQMIYNYARFGSFTDFGIQYSLTINDFTRSEYSPQMAFIGFYNFLFAFPVIKPEFPFIFSNFSDLGVNGYYFIANRVAIGQFFRVIPTFAFLLLPRAVRSLKKDKRAVFTSLWTLCCIILPCVVIYSIWESGYGVRYCVDFSWQMTVGAFAILFILYQKSQNEAIKKLCRYALAISLLMCAFVNIASFIEYISSSNEAVIAQLAKTLEFWK